MDELHPNENVVVKILPGAGKAFAPAEEEKIRQLVRRELLLTSRETYRSATAEVKYSADGTPEAVIAYLNRLATYTADVFTIFLGPDYAADRIEAGQAVEDG